MASTSFLARRDALETYFDRTAAQAWEQLTSDAPVSGVRATVRAGRDRMRATLLDWMGADLRGARLLDAGCGTGALSIEAAARGADVVAIDIAGNLVDVARRRAGGLPIDWRVGDMLDPALGRFDFVVAMDSLIHYRAQDIAATAAALGARTQALLFTVAPRTPALTAMHAVGKLFPRGDRSPAIEPVAPARLKAMLPGNVRREMRVTSGFYISHALELRP